MRELPKNSSPRMDECLFFPLSLSTVEKSQVWSPTGPRLAFGPSRQQSKQHVNVPVTAGEQQWSNNRRVKRKVHVPSEKMDKIRPGFRLKASRKDFINSTYGL